MRQSSIITAARAKFARGKFDSQLQWFAGGNGRLTLYLSYYLNFVDHTNLEPSFTFVQGNRAFAKDYNKKAFPLAPWTEEERKDFADEFADVVMDFWDERFWLRPEIGWFDEPRTGSGGRWFIRPKIDCRLQLWPLSKTGNWHQKVNVVKIDYDELKKRSKGVPPDYRSDARHLTEADVFTTSRTSKIPVDGIVSDVDMTQTTAAHEAGHMIGEDHILGLLGDDKCRRYPTWGELRCYDAGGPPYDARRLELARNVMGLGNHVIPENALPWCQRIAEHTQTSPTLWQVWTMPITPNQISFASRKEEAARWQGERADILQAMRVREEIPLSYHELF